MRHRFLNLSPLFLCGAVFGLLVSASHQKPHVTETAKTAEDISLSVEALKSSFDDFNEQYFDGVIPGDTTIEYASMELMGLTTYERHKIQIYIDQDTKPFPKVVLETLLHEMTHAYLHVKGVQEFDPHGHLFLQKMRDLEDQGAFDDLF